MGPLIPKASFHTQTKMWRTIATDTLSAMHFASRLSPFSSSPSTPLASVRRTILAHYHLPSLSPSKPQSLSLPKTLVPFTTNSAKAAAASSLLVGPRSGFCLVIVRCVSSVSSAPTLEWNEPVSCSEVGDSCSEEVVNGNIGTVEDDAKPSIPVRAYFFSTSVDLRSLVEQNRRNFIPPTSRMTNYVVFKFGELSDSDGLGASLSGSDCRFMVVFQYGSIVLFNVREHEVDGYLKIVEKHASGLLPEMRKDEYEVREKPTLSTWMRGGLDYIMLQHLNTDGIRTIGSVLGQSIALDYYVRQVDGMVAEFTDINRGMETTGKFKMKRKKLFQLVGKANSNLADVILKLGLFERSDIAWKDAKYAQIWEYLRDEFELTQRFASLDFKLKFVEHNIRFLQEILQNRKSDFLEWLIIALIGAEILLSLYDIAHRSALTSL
ncbi:protein RETARDED ROOT GROWTH-LIKE [Ziziphus jujuba]|uniref:Protein RETARDED ROOT GROWTH-LIKE n=1 Tax=Ziziphus jujuba TaxID=326968 RepID=A0A6P3ZFE5_ZIZJJ|nr:protein RETARDED ROOT GROWTH-LIKE [Ziziphus jujuba]